MPLYPKAHPQDVIVCCQMSDIAASTAVNFASPVSGRLKLIALSTRAATNAAINIILQSQLGIIALATLPNPQPLGLPFYWEIPLVRNNWVDAGEAFIISSDGAGSTGAVTNFLAVINRG